MNSCYFAYGSNMSESQMKERCPKYKKIGIAKLENYELTFPRKSKKRSCGVSSVDPKDGKEVWGVVYELNEDDFASLDEEEGYRQTRAPNENSYNREQIKVSVEGMKDPLECWTYIAVREVGSFKPNKKYMDAILAGARENHLPEFYIGALGVIQVQD